jgi:dimethylglycine dehydrogenase
MEGAPWDYGIELIPEDIDRIAPELAKGFERYPVLNDTGIRKWVNGAFTFAPDGNPLVGPVPGVPNYWLACGVMAGFSQGGGVGKSLAEWMIHGEPEADVFGMDIARFGRWASNREYLRQTTGQFYSRRFVMAYPNEQLPAGRPLRVTPSHDAHLAAGARFGVSWGLEVPLFFAPSKDFEETPTLKRSNAFDIVAAETRTVRDWVGLIDTSGYSRYEIGGPGAAAWLDRMLACRLPAVGRARLAPMLSPTGRLMGDLTVFNWDGETFWLMGSYYLREWHMRWFRSHAAADVTLRDVSDAWTGWLVSGPTARALMERVVVNDSVAAEDFRFMACRDMDIGLTRAKVGRLSVLGELGYEINVAAPEHRMLRETLVAAGEGLVTLAIDADGADARGFEPVWIDGKRVGFVTSGGYGHSVGMSLALALVDGAVAAEGTTVDVHVVGEKRPARIIADSPYDPSGARLRG